MGHTITNSTNHMSSTEIITLPPQATVQHLADAFRETRHGAAVAMADTATKAIEYGRILEEARAALPSPAAFDKWLCASVQGVPLADSKGCLRLAARFRNDPKMLLHRDGNSWMQKELGIMPPPGEPTRPASQRSDVIALAKLLAKIGNIPYAERPDDEQAALRAAWETLGGMVGDA